jgi:DNA-binding MarR family transcriptional regulator
MCQGAGVEFEQADRLNGAIRTIAIRHRALTAAHLSKLGLYPGQEAVLLSLDQHGEQTQAELAAHAGCEPPSITSMVRKLQSRGLVERRPSPTDARAMLVSVTPDGRRAIRELKDIWCDIADQTMSRLTVDIDAVLPAVAALAEALDTNDRKAQVSIGPPGTTTIRVGG